MYSRILVPLDGSDASRKGLDEAIKIALEGGAQLKLVHVVNEIIVGDGYMSAITLQQLISSHREAGEKLLSGAEAMVREKGVAVQTELIETIGRRAADTIIAAAEQWGADLIVMGTHGRRGLRRLALGSDAELVLRHATVPVLMVRDVQAE